MPGIENSIHKCNEKCVCPHHQLLMYYWPKGKSHACQNPECEYARGYEDALVRKMLDRRYETARDF